MSILAYVEPGDRVRDPLDDGRIRTVAYVMNDEVYMTDGGVMGAEEIEDVFLPSEEIK